MYAIKDNLGHKLAEIVREYREDPTNKLICLKKEITVRKCSRSTCYRVDLRFVKRSARSSANRNAEHMHDNAIVEQRNKTIKLVLNKGKQLTVT